MGTMRIAARMLATMVSAMALPAWAANQTIDFAGMNIPGGIASSVDWDGYRVAVTGGSQPYLQNAPPNFGTVAPNENITVRVTRVDGADFTAFSATVSNADDNNMTVAGYNNGALVGGTSTTVAGGLTNQTKSLASAVVDEIRITVQTNATFAQGGTLHNFVVVVPNLPPTLASYAGTRSYTIGGAAVTLDGGTAATLADGDSADFNGGSVRVTGYSGEVATQDVLGVDNIGTITLDLGTGEVRDSGTAFGQVASNGQAGADLLVSLNANATPARVQNLIRALTYYNSELASPYIHARTLQTMVSDGDGALPKVYNTTINFTLPADPPNTQKVTFNAATTVPDISATTATSFTSQGFTFSISGGSGAYLQAGGTFPGSPGANLGTTGGGTVTLTINRGGTDFSLDSFVFGNATSQNNNVDLRLNGASVTTRVLPAAYAQRMDFGGITIDEIRVSGNSSASGFFQAGTFDELIYYPANLSPSVGALQGDTVTFTQGGAAVAIDNNGNATVADADSANFDTGSLRVAIVQNEWSAQDVLQVGNVGTITVSGVNVLDGATQIGTVTSNGSGGNDLVVNFNANATPARVQNLMRALQYNNTDGSQPDLGNRSLLITVMDGDNSSPSETTTTVRVFPSALPSGRVVTLNYSGLGSQPVNTTQVDFQNYRMSITGGFQRYLQSGSEGPSPPGIYGGDTGISSQTMSLTRVDAADFFAHSVIVRNYNLSQALTVKSRNNNVDVQTLNLPAGATRRLLFTDTNAVDQITVTGPTGSTNGLLAYVDELAVVPPNVVPDAVTTVAALAYTENAAATAIDSGFALTDPDNNWTGGLLRAQITTNASAADELGIGAIGSVTLSALNVQVGGVTKGTVNAATVTNGNPLTITTNASATTADVQAIARAITFRNSSDAPSTSARTITFTVTDAANASDTATRQINVSAVNDVPQVTTASALNYTENQAATAINGVLTVSDADHATLQSGSVAFTAGFVSGQDVLGFTNVAGMGNIAGSYAPGTGVLTLTSAGGTATLAQWQTALRAVTYSNSSESPSTATRSVAFLVNDGVGPSSSLINTISISAVNDPPQLASTSTVSYTENAPALAINTALTVADVDHATLSSGTVSITGGFQSGQDVLGFVNAGGMGNIAGSYAPGSGVLTLTSAGATATLAQWQAALRAVTYVNSSDAPITATRTLVFVANDGAAPSSALNSTVDVAAVNDPPAVTTPTQLDLDEDGTAALAAVDVQDVDAGGADLAMVLSVGSGTLSTSGAAGVAVSGAPGSVVQVVGTAAALDAWLGAGNSLFYTPVAGSSGAQTLSIATSDNGASPGPAGNDSDSVAINIRAVPDAEVTATLNDGLAFVNVGDPVVYTATLSNAGPEPILIGDGARAQFALPDGLTNLQWTCSGTGTCTASGSGAIDDAVALPVGGVVTYLIGGTATAGSTMDLVATFGIAAAPALQSNNPLDDTATDTNEVRLFADGFE